MVVDEVLTILTALDDLGLPLGARVRAWECAQLVGACACVFVFAFAFVFTFVVARAFVRVCCAHMPAWCLCARVNRGRGIWTARAQTKT